MTTTSFAESATAARESRVAGVCYLLVIAGGVFAALFVREALITPGDAVTTARAIAANEAWWRGLLPAFVGELSLALWLTVKGVKPAHPVVA